MREGFIRVDNAQDSTSPWNERVSKESEKKEASGVLDWLDSFDLNEDWLATRPYKWLKITAVRSQTYTI
jgi:hypothetical protein